MKRVLNILLMLMLLSGLTEALAQTTYTVPTSGNQTVTTCDAWIYDNGGANGNYSSSCDGYLVIYPASGGIVSITGGTYNTESSWDKITIYSGVGTGGTQLAQWSGTGTVSTPLVSAAADGALTIKFYSDGSVVYSGFALHVECVFPETMSSNALSSCSLLWMDPGGTGNYANSQDVTQTICSDNGEHLVVSFNSFALSSGDNLYVYDGEDISAPQLGSYTGTTLPPLLVSSGECLTFRFTSNASGVNSGWVANVSCADEIFYNVPSSGNQSVTTCDAWIYDVGGSDANYPNSCNGYLVIYPSTPGSLVSITEGTYNTESVDKITIYNGVGTSGTQLAQWSGTGSVSGPIVSTAADGALTIKFYSDGSVVYSGFALHVECFIPETMSENSLTACSLLWTDPGGSGNYANNQDITQTICSDNGEHVLISFNSFALSSGDYLYVYDGEDVSAPQLGSYTGTTLPPSLISSGECLTFRFTSNASGVNSGWAADISCVDEMRYLVPSSGNQSVTTCDAWVYDVGGSDGNYTNSCNGYLVIYPSTPGALVSITEGSYHTESLDKITVYSGVGTGGTQLVQWSGTGTVPSPIVSTAANGALTIKFYSDGSVVYSGFALHVECIIPATMSDTSLTACSLLWTDPGGSANYANNQDVTQTICSENNEQLTVAFTSFSLSSGDYLYVYDGASTSAPLLGSYTGSTLPPYVLSSGSCLTFRFTSNSSGTNIGWVASINCAVCTPQNTGPGSPCAFDNINPFCTDQGQYTYASGTTGTADDFFGEDIDEVGCLYSTPGPAWYYMRIDQPGDLTIYIQQQSVSSGSGLDVDFACWGPFSAPSTSAFVDNLCCGYYSLNIEYHSSNTSNTGYPYGNLVDCSYDARSYEYCHIHNAHTGEYYLLLITNYSRQPGTITFNSTSTSSATTDCSIMAQVANTGPYCEGDTIHLICNNPQPGATYSWTGPGGWTSSEVNPIIYPATLDMDGDEYSLVKTYDGSSSEPATTTINMISLNTVITVSPSTTICAGQQATLSTTCDVVSSGSVSGSCTNLWMPGGQHSNRITVSPSETTTYTLEQNLGGCVGYDTVTIEVYNPSTQIHASDTVICRGDTVTLSSDCPAGSSTCVWQWLPGQLSGAMVQVTPQVTTSYTLRQTIDGCLATDAVQIRVNQPVVNTDTIFRVVARDSLPYVFLGQSYPDVGAYDIHLSTVHGCDSLITLVLLYPDTIRATADSVICPDQFPLEWNGVTFYQDSTAEAYFIAHNGADSVLQMTVRHYPTPIQSVNMVTDACAGDTLPVSIGVLSSSNLVIVPNAAIQGGAQKIFIPDGISCAPYGTYYRSIANFNQFIPGAVMTSVNDILYVRLKMEHSALEDLKMSVVCPDGRRSKLVADYNNLTESWDNIPNNYFRTCLGLPNRLTDEVTCDSTQNPMGVAWNYIWSNNSNHNYQYAAGTYGYCYEPVNLQSYANPYWDFYSEWQWLYDSYTTHKSVKPSNPENMTQIYHPYQNFSSLIGCPLNGQWYIEVQDLMEEDNGYLTEWELALAPSLLQMVTPIVVSGELIGPWVTRLTDSTFTITPPYDLSADTTVPYQFVLQTDVGCVYDTAVQITFHRNYARSLDTAICEGELPFVWEGLTFTSESNELLNLQSVYGCDSIVQLNLTLKPSAASDTTAEACGRFHWYEHRNILNSCDNLTHVFTTQSGCDSVVTLHLTVFPLPVPCFDYYTLGENYELGAVLHFEECTPGMVNYHWDMDNSVVFEDPSFDYEYPHSGAYRVSLRVTDENGCTAERHRVVVIKDPEMQIFIPNSFTPNQDGLNETFKPTGLHITDDHYLFVIYDRWGEVVFKTTNPEEGWDGKYKGAIVPNGSVMAYTLRCASDQGMVKRKGAVVVVY